MQRDLELNTDLRNTGDGFLEGPSPLLDRARVLSSSGESPLLTARGLFKTFGRTTVLSEIDFDLSPGEIRAVVGENGAGKTTLMNLLSGRTQPDRGELQVLGRTFDSLTPALAWRLGIVVVPQHIELVPQLSIADNVSLNRWPTRGYVINRRRVNLAARQVLDEVGIGLDVSTLVQDLTYVQKQMLEIGRILQFGPRILILDEPTAALSAGETTILFRLVKRLVAQGIGVVYVSHYLEEVRRLADSVMVLRGGQVVISAKASALSIDELGKHMTGNVPDLYPSRATQPGAEVRLRVRDARFGLLSGLTFEVRAREILGLAAPKGEGVSEFLRRLCGVTRGRLGGEVYLDSKPIRIKSAWQACRAGIGYLGEERARWGIIPGRSVPDNIRLTSLARRRGLFRWISGRADRSAAAESVARFGIKVPTGEPPISVLSGGNQQKALLARLLTANLTLYVLDDPTHGVDVGSKAQINAHLAKAVDDGAAILLHSTDLSELLHLSDRILLIREGRVVAHYMRGEVTLQGLERSLEGQIEMNNEPD
jgi:ABC-type sugar transport system ATPase subunit